MFSWNRLNIKLKREKKVRRLGDIKMISINLYRKKIRAGKYVDWVWRKGFLGEQK